MSNYPIPNQEIESAAIGASAVTTRQMTDEEWAKYGPADPTKKLRVFEKIDPTRPVVITSDQQSRSPNVRHQNEKITDRNGEELKTPIRFGHNPNMKETIEVKTEKIETVKTVKPELTKEIYLQEKEAGKPNAQIERDYGLKANHIYYLLQKWGMRKTTEPKAANPNMPVTPVAKGIADERLKEIIKDESSITGMDIADMTEVQARKIELSKAPSVVPEQPYVVVRETEATVRPKQKSKRSMRIESVGDNISIEDELVALINYVQLMEGKSFSLELSLVEVAET